MSDAGPSKRVKVRHWGDVPSVSAMPEQRCVWIVAQLIAQATVTLLSGISGHGKSYFALALAAAVASGKPFAGLPTVQLPVLYLDRENPAWLVQQRMREMGIEDGDNFKYLGNWLSPQPPGPAHDKNHPLSVKEFVLQSDPRPLVVFDTSTAFFDGRSEADPTEVRQFMDCYRSLADLGATVAVLIHASEKSKSGNTYRGSTDFLASVDAAYKIEKRGKGQLLEQLNLACFKARYRTHEKLQFRFDGARFELDAKLNPATDTTLAKLLQENPGIGMRRSDELTKDAHIPRDYARQWLDAHIESGEIERTETGEKNAVSLTWVGRKPRTQVRGRGNLRGAKTA